MRRPVLWCRHCEQPARREDGDGPPRQAAHLETGTELRAAGLELRRRGFTVRLNTFPDQESLELCADISVTGSSGIVCIADSGTICFERSYWADHASAGRAPRDPGWLPDPAACAAAIAGTVTAAIAAAQPRRHTG